MVRMLYVNVCKCSKVCIIFYSVHILFCSYSMHGCTVESRTHCYDTFVPLTIFLFLSYVDLFKRQLFASHTLPLPPGTAFFWLTLDPCTYFDIQTLYMFMTFHPWTYSMELTALVHITPFLPLVHTTHIFTPCTYNIPMISKSLPNTFQELKTIRDG